MSELRIVVGASIAKYHALPGRIEHRMAYVRGFERLGHEVYLVDDLGAKAPEPGWAAGFERVARSYGVWDRSALVHGVERATHGLSYAELLRVADSTDVLVNIQGRVRDPALLERVGRRVYVDGAPGFTQVYEGLYGIDQRLGGHDAHFTYGLNIGASGCAIPDCGLAWRPLVPPIVLDDWPPSPPPRGGRFTTISRWDSDPTFEVDGRHAGRKRDNWRRFRDLPRRASRPLELALDIAPDYAHEISAFQAAGWALTDARALRTPDDYAVYIRGSRGELSVANGRYVDFATGWFSERSVRYLASGRPVVVQSTGIESHLPVGLGIVTFSEPAEAVAALDAVDGDYARHHTAAREIAEAYFDSHKVLSGLLEVA